jgi:hypothetical protein
VAVLYYLEGLQPFTRRHGYALVAAVPFVLIALLVRGLLPGPVGALVGTGLGFVAYATTLGLLGFTPVERRLVGTLMARYSAVVGDLSLR